MMDENNISIHSTATEDGFINAGMLVLLPSSNSRQKSEDKYNEFPDLSFAPNGQKSYSRVPYDGSAPGAMLGNVHAEVLNVLNEAESALMLAAADAGDEEERAETAEHALSSTSSLTVVDETFVVGDVLGNIKIKSIPDHQPGIPAAAVSSSTTTTTSTSLSGAEAMRVAPETGISDTDENDEIQFEAFSHLFSNVTATATIPPPTAASSSFANIHSTPTASEDDDVSHVSHTPSTHLPASPTLQNALELHKSAEEARAALPEFLREMCEEGLQAVQSKVLGGGGGDVKMNGKVVQLLSSPPILPKASTTAKSAVAATSSSSSSTTTTTTTPIRIAVAQIHAVPGDIQANIQKLSLILDSFSSSSSSSANTRAQNRIDVLVLPETWLQGYHIGIRNLRTLAISVYNSSDTSDTKKLSPYMFSVSALSAKHQVSIVVGFAELESSSSPTTTSSSSSLPSIYNSLALFDGSDEGKLIRVYRKTHLWDPDGTYEKAVFTPGSRNSSNSEDNSNSQTSGAAENEKKDPFQPCFLKKFPHLPIGLLVCFDLEFPEPSRILATRGTKILIASTAMGEKEGFASRVYARARALENHMCVVFSNYPSSPPPLFPSSSSRLAGGSGSGGNGDGNEYDDDTQKITASGGPLQNIQYSGGSCVVAPTGFYLNALPAYAYPPPIPPSTTNGKGGPFPGFPGQRSVDDDEEDEGKREDAHATMAATNAIRSSSISSSSMDEHVIVATFSPADPLYASDVHRNPYLQDRRVDLYG